MVLDVEILPTWSFFLRGKDAKNKRALQADYLSQGQFVLCILYMCARDL